MNLPQNQQFVRLLISMGWQPIHPINVKTGKKSHEVVGCLYSLSNGDHVCYRCCYTFSFSQKDHVKPYCKNDTIDFGDWHVVMTDDLADMAKQLHAYVENKAKLLIWLEKQLDACLMPETQTVDQWVSADSEGLDCHISTSDDEKVQDTITAVFYPLCERHGVTSTDTQTVVVTMQLPLTDYIGQEGKKYA